jgi:hypothetical protein
MEKKRQKGKGREREKDRNISTNLYETYVYPSP